MRDTEQQCPSFSNKENKIFVSKFSTSTFEGLNLSFRIMYQETVEVNLLTFFQSNVLDSYLFSFS